MLSVKNSVLVVIDMQEKLSRAMHDRENLVTNAVKIIHGAKVLGLPVIWTEQNPRGLGSTLPEIREHIPADSEPIIKLSFSCCAEPAFLDKLNATGRKQALVLGIESHVCVLQTVIDLIHNGYNPIVVEDCISSRKPNDKLMAIERMRKEGATITTYEAILFELLRYSGGETFKGISKLVK